jgi:DNA-binding transcriptional MocR family regulator
MQTRARGGGMSFARFPNKLLEAKLGLHANAVFGALAYHDKQNTGVVFPNLRTIADLAGLSINPVRAALRKLSEEGWIEIRERNKRGSVASSEYRLNYKHTVSRRDTATVSPEDTATVSPTVSFRGLSPYHRVTPNKKKEKEEENRSQNDRSLKAEKNYDDPAKIYERPEYQSEHLKARAL